MSSEIYSLRIPRKQHLKGRLYLGTAAGAKNLFLHKKGRRPVAITHVVRLCNSTYTIPKDVTVIQDTEVKETVDEADNYYSVNNNTARSAKRTTEHMWEVLQNQPNAKILVHCKAGHNRSVGQLMHYLSHAEKMPFDTTYQTVFLNPKTSSLPKYHMVNLGIYEHFQKDIQGLPRFSPIRKSKGKARGFYTNMTYGRTPARKLLLSTKSP